MKAVILPDHIGINKYTFTVIGLPPLTPTEVSGIEEELEIIELPDRTVATAGDRGVLDFSISLPMHHSLEQAAMEAWYLESQGTVAATYKKQATLLHESNSGAGRRVFELEGVFPYKRTLPDLEMAAEGDLAVVQWGLRADSILPLG